MKKFLVTFLFLVIIGSVGAAVYLYYQQRVTDHNQQVMGMAEAYYDAGDYDKSIESLKEVVDYGKGFENSEKALYLLAKSYQEKNVPEAVITWQKFIEQYPESQHFEEAKLHLANTYLTQDINKARQIFVELEKSGNQKIQDQARLGIAKTYEQENNSEKARELYYNIIENAKDLEVIAHAKDHLTKQNTERLWTPALDEFSELYTVQPGDSPIEIAGKFKTTAWFIKEANNISNTIHPGKRLKVLKEPLYVVVNKDTCRLNLLTESGKFVKWYPVGIGTESWKTPAGDYEIINKEIDPVWYRPGGGIVPSGDEENALGTRWMGIGNSLGIHGTNAPNTIGKRESAGCIRMYNKDAEELYKLITYGTRVVIEEGNTNQS